MGNSEFVLGEEVGPLLGKDGEGVGVTVGDGVGVFVLELSPILIV